ncbi:MAG: PSD1 and planctomycete cytochrome C domain-containing protein [Verrucomicrobiota bacterium]
MIFRRFQIFPLAVLPMFLGLAQANSVDPSLLEFFEKEVRPILVERCYECHSAAGQTKGGLRLDSRLGVATGGDTGPSIIPGRPGESLLIEAIRYQNRDLQMPPKNALPDLEIAILEKWVALGAPDPRESDEVITESGMGMSIEEGREFWSFKPVAKPTVPRIENAEWVATPIDAFILEKLREQAIEPAPPADKRTLIRRITFDLVGLPPTPEEVDAFLADHSPKAVLTLVERLLESPQYGVRWGRHWLDVARYADSNGLDENLAFGQAWRYRDYVIDSFNRDKPFDQFLVEQVAGDLLPDANRETKVATGFLALGAKVLAEPDRAKLDMDIIDEQLDTLGKSFLGMTLGCVRCHDHKFDPITQRDYYALAAIFKSTRSLGDTKTGVIKHWFEHSFASEAELDQLKEVDTRIAEKKKAASGYKSKAIIELRNEARSKATDYLVAAAKLDPGMALTDVAKVAQPLGLHPRILYHSRRHLDFHRSDPFFRTWHEFAKAGNFDAIGDHYRALFHEAEAAFAAARQQDAKAKGLEDVRLEPARAALFDNSGFLAVPAKPDHAFDDATLAEYHRLMNEARVEESKAPDAASAMGVSEATVVASLPIHIRGSYKSLGESISRNVPEVMRASHTQPVFPNEASGRLQLAQWMASSNHPLTARVFVNRIWGWHFGNGLVKTTENFGKLGDRPSHPALLDWLATYFVESGWSVKELHRLILTSNSYQMASSHPDATVAESIDPENRLLWRANIQRLEAEPIRDAILSVAGRLDLTMRGKTLRLRNRQFVFNHTSEDHTKYDSLRRAVYLPVIRNNLYTFFEQFDYPDPTMPTGHRNATVVAPQALLMMNADLLMDSAESFASQLLETAIDPAYRVEQAYLRAFARLPTSAEARRALAFIDELTSTASVNSAEVNPAVEKQAWSLLCQSLLASNEFLYLR